MDLFTPNLRSRKIINTVKLFFEYIEVIRSQKRIYFILGIDEIEY